MTGAHPSDGSLAVTGDSSERFNLMYIVYIGKLTLGEGKSAWPSAVVGHVVKLRREIVKPSALGFVVGAQSAHWTTRHGRGTATNMLVSARSS